MKHRWLRFLSALLCVQLILSCMPVLSEETPDAAIEIVEIAEIAEIAEEIVEEMPAAEPEGETAEDQTEQISAETTSPAPEAEPTMEIMEESTAAPTAEPTAEPTSEATAEQTAEPTPAPSAEPDVGVSALPTAPLEPEVLPENAVMLLSVADTSAVIDAWLAELEEEDFSREYDRAFWLYEKLIDTVKPDNSSSAKETVEAALLDGKAGSLGFARTYEALLDAASIASDILTERSDDNEAWNLVRIDGKWTHVDAFHDARSGRTGECFGLTDGAMDRYHNWSRSAYECTTVATNYYLREKGYTACGEFEPMFKLLQEAIREQREQLKIYWYGEEEDANITLALSLLATIAPDVEISGSEEGCYCIINLDFSQSSVNPTPTVTPAPTPVPGAVEIIPPFESLTMGLGEERSIAGWTLEPVDAQDSVTYSSSNSSRVSVDKKGMLTAKKTGSATITLETESGAECEIEVTVRKEPSKITSFVAEALVIGEGESTSTRFSFNSGAGGGVYYSSNDEIVATVDENGVITAHKRGEATITITSYNGLSKSGVITVKKAPSDITLSETEVLLGMDDQWQLDYKLSRDSVGAVSFISSDEKVASVDAEGRISALKAGTAVITAETYNGLRASCTVTVSQSPEAVSLSAARTTIGVGEKLQLIARIQPEGTLGTLEYSTSSSRYVSVDEHGVITGKKAGSAEITVETYNGRTDELEITVKKAPSDVRIRAEKTSFGVGETVQLMVELPSGSAGGYTLTSSDEKKLTIDENAVATAHAGGMVKVLVETYNGKTDTIELNIVAEPERITLTETQVSIGVGDAWQLGYSMNEGAGGAVSFSSTNPAVASVDAQGNISALKKGTAIITVEAVNGVFAQCFISVVSAPAAVEFITERRELGEDEELQLQARILPEGTVGSLRYSSSNSKYISVDESGVVTAKRIGSAVITVETYNGRSADIELRVLEEPDSISFVSDHSSMGVGETALLTASLPEGSAGAYSYASSDESILTIDENGNATAHGEGEVKVAVTAYNGKRKVQNIIVSAAPTMLNLARTSVSIGAQDAWQLSYSFGPGEGGCVKFASSDDKVASIAEDGMISAHKEGLAVITARSYNGIEAQCVVLVVAAPEKLVLSAPRMELGQGESMQLFASTLPDGALGMMKYSSSNSKYISVDENGVVTGVRKGTATITAEAYNGVKGSIKLTVMSEPKSISLATDRTVLGLGESAQLTASINENSAGGYRFMSGDEKVLTIDENGVATAHAVGEAKVTVEAYNGVKKSGTITVMEAPKLLLLSPAEMKLGVGDSAFLSAQINEGAAGAVSFEAANPEIASIDARTGEVTARAIGVTRLTAATYNGVRTSVTLRVYPQPDSIRVPYGILDLGVGDKVQLEPIIDEGTATSFSYSTSSKKYATVDEYGIVTGERVGSAEITIETSNGLKLVLTVKVRKAPDSVELTPGDMILGVGESVQLSAIIPENCAASMIFETLDPEIAVVDESGLLTAVSKGATKVRVETYNGESDIAELTVVSAPKSIEINAVNPIGVGQQTQLTTVLLPEGSHSTVRYEVVNGDAVQVDENGLITGMKVGTATIRAATHVEGVADTFRISVKPAPESITFDAEEYEVSIEDTFQLKPILSPSGCVTGLTYTVARAGFFTLDENGLITPIMRGSTTVTATTHNGLSAKVTIRIIDPYFPEELSFIDTPPAYLEVGDGYTPIIGVYPETAVADLTWSSSDEDIASVDPKTGRVLAESHGSATIEAVSGRNPALMLSYKLTVLSPERCLTMPARRTDTSKISTTQSQIKQVRSSAYRELEAIYSRGEISKSEYNTRKSIVSNAFDMYLFPWMTKEVEPYWSAANSEDGAKDFKPGIVYHGLPYTQTNRRYNVTTALSKGYYHDSGKGYYLMDNGKISNRMYAGNDCSSFASMSVWGTGKSHSYDTTRDIANTSVYTTIKDWDDLRTGDLLNSYNHHVVIFLYWANESHTQMVIIEQGGGEAGTNTVSTSLRRTTYYQEKGYSVRRLTSLM